MRLYSSDQIVRALERFGCRVRWQATRGRRGKGSHCVMVREVTRSDGSLHRLSAPVVLGQREMARFTLRSVLKLLEIGEEEFEAAVR